MGSGQGGVVCELCEDEVKLMVGSAWAEEGCSGWSTVSFELPGVRVDDGGVRVDGGGVLWFRGGEPERERAE